MPIAVRAASIADLDPIVDVFLACWRESYAAVLPPRLIEAMTDAQAVALWGRVLRVAEPGEVLVVESVHAPGAIVGVARTAAGPGAGTDGVVHSLYVSPSAQGGGEGSRLLAAAGDALRAGGASTAHLWVFRDNTPSVAFYRHHGWLPDGSVRVEAEFGEPEIRLATVLATVVAVGPPAAAATGRTT